MYLKNVLCNEIIMMRVMAGMVGGGDCSPGIAVEDSG